MPKPKKSTERQRAAYHEAGHAVVTVWLFRRFRYVTITPDNKSNSAGHVLSWKFSRHFRPDEQITPAGRALIDAEVTILDAGRIAEKRFAGRYNHVGANADNQSAITLASYVADPGDRKVCEAYLKWRWLVAESIVKARWANIESVAAALLQRQRLSCADVREICFGPPLVLEGLSKMAATADRGGRSLRPRPSEG